MIKKTGVSIVAAAILAVAGTPQNPQGQKLSQELLKKYFKVDMIQTKNDVILEKVTISGPEKPPLPTPKGIPLQTLQSSSSGDEGDEPQATSEGTTNILLEVPGFNWSFGCSATSAAMIAGYYDRTGYPYVYAGPTNEGKTPMDNSVWPDWVDSAGDTRHQAPLSATHDGLDGRVGRGHVDDYWISYGSEDDDPYYTNGWEEHVHGECTGDFMKTNQTTKYDNSDGATTFYFYNSGDPLTWRDMEEYDIDERDGGYGFKLFFESRGYTVTELYNQRIDADYDGGFSFEQFKAEIDAGNPVLIHVTGHTMVGMGYDDEGQTVYLRDTWDYDVHTMTWGDSYSGMDHFAVTVIHLAPNKVAGDFNKDGIPDILFRNPETGENLIFFLYETGTRESFAYTTPISESWKAEGIGDFNADGIADILFRNYDTGENLIFFQNEDGTRDSFAYTTKISSAWHVAGIADFNKDEVADILFRNQETGENLIFFQNPDGTRDSFAYTTKISSAWHVAGVADMNKDGVADILFRNNDTGENLIFFMNEDGSRDSFAYTTKISSAWHVAGLGDFNKDGVTDILFRNQETGENLIFFQNPDGTRDSFAYTTKISSAWIVAGVRDYNGDKIADIFFRNTEDGKNIIFFMNADGSRAGYKYTTPLSTSWIAVR